MFQRMLDIGGGSSGGVDVSDTTAIESDVLEGKIFHLADGSVAIGTLVKDNPYEIKYFENANLNGVTDFIAPEDGNYVFVLELASTTHTFSYTTNGTEIRKTAVIKADNNADSYLQIIVLSMLRNQHISFTHGGKYSSFLAIKIQSDTVSDIQYVAHIENISTSLTSSGNDLLIGLVRTKVEAEKNISISDTSLPYDNVRGDLQTIGVSWLVAHNKNKNVTISGQSSVAYGRSYMIKVMY